MADYWSHVLKEGHHPFNDNDDDAAADDDVVDHAVDDDDDDVDDDDVDDDDETVSQAFLSEFTLYLSLKMVHFLPIESIVRTLNLA